LVAFKELYILSFECETIGSSGRTQIHEKGRQSAPLCAVTKRLSRISGRTSTQIEFYSKDFCERILRAIELILFDSNPLINNRVIEF